MSKTRFLNYLLLFLFTACSNGSGISNAEIPNDLMDRWVGTWNVEVTRRK